MKLNNLKQISLLQAEAKEAENESVSVTNEQTKCYGRVDEAADEFAAEWTRLGSHLQESGGLEEAIRRSSESLDPILLESRKTARMKDTLTKISLAASRPSGKESAGQ